MRKNARQKTMLFQDAMKNIIDSIAALEKAKKKLEAGDMDIFDDMDEAYLGINAMHFDLDEGWKVEPKKEG